MVGQAILVVEDDKDIRELVRSCLTKEEYLFAAALSGEEALVAVESKTPDLIILDIILPGLDGLTVCRRLKENPKFDSIPIIMLTARGEEADIVAGLNMGADDYVTKPFSHKVLLARVQAVLRRAKAQYVVSEREQQCEVIELRDLTIHLRRHEVSVGDRPVELSAIEFKLLHLLAQHPGWVFTRQQILDAVHSAKPAVTRRAVDVEVVGLRKKLGLARSWVQTVRGVGYRFQK
jgi:two-component system, OmpR family, alkaline phosphatase synthesis response regulator PhoP